MPAITHPGAVIHCWDHLVITLRAEPDRVESGFLSLYAIAYSASLGAGHVAILEAPSAGGNGLAATLTDDLGLGERQQKRLIAIGEPRAALREPPVKATFERMPFGADGFGFRLTTEEHDIEARWEAPEPPFWVDGQNGAFHDSEDIWAMMVGAQRARLIVDGVALAGAPFEDDIWTPKLGRPLSSAHGAFAEVRVQPVSGRATGTGSGGPR
jgi:hypothetical protein